MTIRYKPAPKVVAPPSGIAAWMRWVEGFVGAVSRANAGDVAVTGKNVAGGSIQQGALAQGALDSFLITSPNIQSSDADSGLSRYRLDDAGMHFFDADGNLTIDFDAATGRSVTTGKTATAPDGVYPRAELDDLTPTNDADGYTRQITGLRFFTGDGEAVPFVGVERASGIGDPTSDFVIRYYDPLSGNTGQIVVDGNGLTVTGNLAVSGQAPGAQTGMVTLFAGTVAPAGYLLANGAAVSRTTYATLFGVIGTTYGAGNGTTTFTLPAVTAPAGLSYIIKS
jgi:hypothetical protein